MSETMIPLEATARTSVTLTNAEWQSVLGALGEAPYRIAYPLVQSIVTQVRAAPAASREEAG